MAPRHRYRTRLAQDTPLPARYGALIAEVLDDQSVGLDPAWQSQVVEELLAKAGRWPRRVQALRLRYGLGEEQSPQTYRAIGEQLGGITPHGAMQLLGELRQWLRPRLRAKLREVVAASVREEHHAG